MFDKEEKELKDLKDTINNIPKPDSMDEYIKNGIRLAKIKKKKVRFKIFANIAALVVFTILLTSIRVSPVFAAYVSKVPGLKYMVNLINYDKGIEAAVDNNFVQHINISQEHEGLVFTLKDIIIDKSKAIVFYSIENKTNHRFVNISEIKLKDENGKGVIASSAMSLFIEDMMEQKKLVGKVDFNFSDKETILPDSLCIDVKLQDENTNDVVSSANSNVLASTWKFNIPIDKKKFESMKKVYVLNHTIEIQGQKVLFKTVTITPTVISAEIEYDKSNSKKILGFDDIAIINEKGEKWATIMNGMSGSRIDETHEILFFQSNYFTSPKELYIKGSSIKALDKDKINVIVDVDKKTLLKAPDDKLTLKSITKESGKISLEFGLVKDKIMDKDRAYLIFSSDFEDSTGKHFDRTGGYSHLEEGPNQYIGYTISSESKFKSPIYLKVEDYPSRIKGDFKVKIK